MRRVILLVAIILVWSAAAMAALRDAVNFGPDVALTLKIGTLGPGLEATVKIIDCLNVRVAGNYFHLKSGGDISDVKYDFDIQLGSVPILLDLHPFLNGFRITGGIIYNQNMLDLNATPNTDTTIGDNEYTPEQIGELIGSTRFKQWAPYIGIGYGNAVGADKRWGFVFDLGVMWQGSPDVSLSATGPLADNPGFKADLASQEKDIQDDADAFMLYPVLSFGISYQF